MECFQHHNLFNGH